MSSALESAEMTTLRRTAGSHKSSFDEEKAGSDVLPLSEESLESSEVIIEKAEEVAVQILAPDDDVTLPILTFRSIFLGIGLSAFSSVLGTIYTFKPQNASVSQLFVLIIAYVLGEAMSWLPNRGFMKWINPGPFNIKEHTVIVIMSSTASNVAVGMEIIAAMDLFYNIQLNAAVAIFQIFATQMLGYGVAGILRNMLVYPTYAFYPTYISVVNLLQSLHGEGTALNQRKRRFFWIVFACIFCWEWIPQYAFPLLTAVSIVCLADNGRHAFVRNLFGGGSSNEGIGFFSFGFSWTLITQGNPLVWPLQTQANSYLGMFIGYILLTTAYYSNVFNGRDLLWMSTSLFGSDGETYNQTAVIDPVTYHLDRSKLEAAGLPRYTTTYAISQLCYNLSVGSAVTSILLWNWRDLKTAFIDMKDTFRGGASRVVNDPHYEQMKKYPEVPHWVYAALFLISLALGMGLSYAGPDGYVLMPAWSILFFTVFGVFMAVIISFIYATTGFQLSIKYAVQLIAAFLHPGQPIPVMYANLYGNSSSFQTMHMLEDLKLGQYTKVPPRWTFTFQVAGSIVGSIFNYTMMKTIVDANREVLRDPTGTRVWSGWVIQQYNSASVAMGALGKELFSYGKPAGYWILPFGMFIGLFIPIPFFLAHKYFTKIHGPNSRVAEIAKWFQWPIVLQYMGYLPYSVNGQWWTCMVIGFASQWWARKHRPTWFAKYNYLLSAALDGGAQVIIFILSFAVFGASGNSVDFPYWWGNPENLSADRCMATD